MPTIIEILQAHEMRGPKSCIAWGYEFIAKWHGTLDLDQFHIQDTPPFNPLGFGDSEREWFMREYHVATASRPLTDVVAIEQLIRAEVPKDVPPLITLFSEAQVQYQSRSAGLVSSITVGYGHHVFVGLLDDDENPWLAGRLYGQPMPVFLSWDAIRKTLEIPIKIAEAGFPPARSEGLVHFRSESPQTVEAAVE